MIQQHSDEHMGDAASARPEAASHDAEDGTGLPPAPAGSERILIWPHRSLGRDGTMVVMSVAATGFAIVTAWVAAPAAWFVLIPAIICFASLAFAFWLNTRRATRFEIIDITDTMLRVMTSYLGRHDVVDSFNPHWVRIELSDAHKIEKRLILSESGRAVSIGDCLSPAERGDLAATLRQHVANARDAQGRAEGGRHSSQLKPPAPP